MTLCTIYIVYKKICTSIRWNQTLLHWYVTGKTILHTGVLYLSFSLNLGYDNKKKKHDLWYCVYCIFAQRVRFLAHIFICDFKERANLHIVCYQSVKRCFLWCRSVCSGSWQSGTCTEVWKDIEEKKRPAGESSRWKTSTSVPMPDVK